MVWRVCKSVRARGHWPLSSPSASADNVDETSPPSRHPSHVNRTVTPRRRPNAEIRTREHLTEAEIEKLLKAAGKNRWGHRDATMILVAYRHGLRVSELSDLRWDQIDFDHAPSARPPGQAGHPSDPSDSWRRNAGVAEAAARAGAEVAVCVHVGTRLAVLYVGFAKLVERAGSRPPSWASRPTRICCGMPAASRWPIRGTIREPCRPISGTGTSSIRCAIPNCRRHGSRISGRAEAGTTDTVPTAVRSSNAVPTVVRSSFR